MTVCGTCGSTAVTCCTMASISGEALLDPSLAGSNSEGGMIGPLGITGFGGGGGSRLANQLSISFFVTIDSFKPNCEDKIAFTCCEYCSGDSSASLSTGDRNLEGFNSYTTVTLNGA